MSYLYNFFFSEKIVFSDTEDSPQDEDKNKARREDKKDRDRDSKDTSENEKDRNRMDKDRRSVRVTLFSKTVALLILKSYFID